MSTISHGLYNSSNLTDLGTRPFPIENETGLPYNYTSTPIIGNPDGTIDWLSQSWITFYNKVKAPTDASGAPLIGTDLANYPTYLKNISKEALAGHLQEFFYLYQPFVSNEVYNANQSSVGDAGVVSSNAEYYQDLFIKNLKEWASHQQSGIEPSIPDFKDYLNTQTEMKYRQRNVVMWQLVRVVGMIERLNERTLNAGARSVMWAQSSNQALDTMNNIAIPSIKGSSEDVRVPDPDSVATQHAVMMSIERERAKFKRLEEKGRNEDATISYSSDSSSQQRTSLNSFWSSLSNIINNLSN